MTVEALIGRLKDSREDVRKASEENFKTTQNLQEKNKALADVQLEIKKEISAKEQGLVALLKEISLKATQQAELKQTQTTQKSELSVLEKKQEANKQSLDACIKTAAERSAKVDKNKTLSPEEKAKLQKASEGMLSWAWGATDIFKQAEDELQAANKAQKDAETMVEQTKTAILAKQADLEKNGAAQESLNNEMKELREKENTLTGEIKSLHDSLTNVQKEEPPGPLVASSFEQMKKGAELLNATAVTVIYGSATPFSPSIDLSSLASVDKLKGATARV